MQRGSLGQCVGVIIINIPNHESHLSYLILHNEFKEEARLAAMVLAEEFGMEMVIKSIVYEFDKTDWGNLQDGIREMVESYAENYAEFSDELLLIIKNAIYNDTYDNEEIAYAIRDTELSVLVYHEYMIWKIEDNTKNLTVKFYAQQAIHNIMRYKGQLNQDLLSGFESV